MADTTASHALRRRRLNDPMSTVKHEAPRATAATSTRRSSGVRIKRVPPVRAVSWSRKATVRGTDAAPIVTAIVRSLRVVEVSEWAGRTRRT
jgi:hypothetical protein